MKNKTDCKIDIFGDSKLVINQMNDEWQIKTGAYRKFALIAKPLFAELKKKNEVTIAWVPREQNEKADFQSMKALGFVRGKRK